MFEFALQLFGYGKVEIDFSKVEKKSSDRIKKATSFELKKEQALLQQELQDYQPIDVQT